MSKDLNVQRFKLNLNLWIFGILFSSFQSDMPDEDYDADMPALIPIPDDEDYSEMPALQEPALQEPADEEDYSEMPVLLPRFITIFFINIARYLHRLTISHH